MCSCSRASAAKVGKVRVGTVKNAVHLILRDGTVWANIGARQQQ